MSRSSGVITGLWVNVVVALGACMVIMIICRFTNLDFLEFQEVSAVSCTGFLAMFFGFGDIQTFSWSQEFTEALPFGHGYSGLEAGAV